MFLIFVPPNSSSWEEKQKELLHDTLAQVDSEFKIIVKWYAHPQ